MNYPLRKVFIYSLFCIGVYAVAPWIMLWAANLFMRVDRELSHYCLGTHILRSSCLVNKTRLDQKIQAGLPLWASMQIAEDLKPFKTIKRADLDRYADHSIASPVEGLVRIQIKDGKFQGPMVSPKNNSIYYVMQDIFDYCAKHHYVSNVDVLIELGDYFEPKAKMRAPVFVFAKDLEHPFERDMILMPDRINLVETQYLRPMIHKASKKYPWSAKKPILFWRGSTNGDTKTGREALVAWSKEYPTRINAVFCEPHKGSPFVNPEDHLQYRYLISLDGARAAWTRLVWHLHSNSLTFKYDSQHWQWFYKGIKPYVHYIPVHDKASLLQGMDWAEQHPEEVQAIIQRASSFVENNLSMEDMYHYMIVLLQEYEKKMEK